MIIQMDVDGVLADFMKGASEVARSIDPSIPLVDTYTTKDWDHWEGWPQSVVRQTWDYIKDPKNLFFYKLSSLLKRDEWRRLRNLMTPSNQFYFVTSRPGETSKHQTESWLFDRLEIQATVIITPNKAGFAKLMKPDWSIEDNGINAAGISQVCGIKRSCLLDRLYNRSFHPNGSTRISTFTEFLDKIESP